MEKKYYMGIDVGSTTIKIYITDQDDNCIYSNMSDIILISKQQLKH